MKAIRLGIIQAKYEGDKIELNVDKGLKLIEKAKKLNADIIVFPECWIHGYTFPKLKNLTNENMLEMTSYNDTIQNVMNYKEYIEWQKKSLDLDSEYIRRFCNIAKKLSIGIVLTCYTKGKNRPRNTAIIINKNGEIILKYDKVHTCDFSLESMLESGEEFKVCEFDGVNIGVMICYDREYPESARILMLKGAEIIIVPNCCEGMKPRINALKTRAYENMVGIVMANVPSKNGGMSCAIDPIPWDNEGNDLDMEIFVADNISEDIYIAEYDLNRLRNYRENEMMGNTFRKINAYSELLSNEIKKPFIRDKWIKEQ